jgi:flagellar hook-basal body complex protein FliE
VSAPAIAPVAAAAVQALAQTAAPTQALAPSAAPAATSFGQLLMRGIEGVEHRVANADAMVRAFSVDDSVPLHQVTFALEEARLSLELMMQVRARLVEGYQRMMEMQL